MRHYASLGSTPVLADRDAENTDPLLAHSGRAARAMLRAVKRYPAQKRTAALRVAMQRAHPRLPQEVERIAAQLQRAGMNAEMAMERALTLGLADATIEKIKLVGRLYQDGEGYPLGLSGAGFGLGDQAGDVAAGIAQGVACSTAVRDQVRTMVGREEGADAANATTLGFDILRGMSQCPTTTTPAAAPPPPAPREERSVLLPVMVTMGVVAAVGGGLWFMTRKKK